MFTTTEFLLEPQEVEQEKESKKNMESYLNSIGENQNMGTNLTVDEHIVGNEIGNNDNNGNFSDVQNILNDHNGNNGNNGNFQNILNGHN